MSKPNPMRQKMEEILLGYGNYAWKQGLNCIDMSEDIKHDSVAEAILQLMREIVPEERKENRQGELEMYYGEEWNACREEILNRLKEME